MGNNLFVHRLEDRMGASAYTGIQDNQVGQVWMRTTGGYHQFKDASGQIATDGRSYVIQAGMGLLNFGQNDEYNLGLMGAYGEYSG
ncbi:MULTISPECIES: autotransporter outer membrane beta-barrel domain-containing protein, partial [unclassified Acinetobacter]